MIDVGRGCRLGCGDIKRESVLGVQCVVMGWSMGMYRVLVRPAKILYGTKKWALNEAQEKMFDVAEMRML